MGEDINEGKEKMNIIFFFIYFNLTINKFNKYNYELW
jgi:hypothetical protein